MCAEVVIEIQQELALERQAFEAKMRISNGLDTLSLDDVSVDVYFENESGDSVVATSDPSDTSATFFIREDQLTGVDAIDGTGTIAAASEAEVRWLIVPGTSAAGQQSDGKLYFVGATLSYTYGGLPQSIDVAPDTIVVKPQPLLTLDYFLTEEVVGDDAFTPAIEPPVPYTLGVRVSNNGAGVARNVTIDSAQPRIIENEQGLAVSFRINQSHVNDEPAQPTLLLDFGDIPGDDVSVGRWLMETSLSGRFISFSASFTHADELGGELTSLLEAVNTHILLRDVQVDVAGRDAVRDFLARDGTAYHVYESERTGLASAACTDCAEVTDVSGQASLSAGTSSGSLVVHTLTIPALPGFSLTHIPDPYGGTKSINSVVRSDGKVVRARNVWLSRERAENNIDFDHYFNLFDVASSGTYQVTFGDAVDLPQAPVFVAILDRETHEGGQVGFLVQASDPNGDPVALTARNVPQGASFSVQGNGRATFQWFPIAGQAGVYVVEFEATDGALATTLPVNIQVNAGDDTDGDGLPDDWELANFGDLSRDGTGDYDDDGYSDAQEYENDTDPTVPAEAPGSPQVASPAFGAEVAVLTPQLEVVNAIHGSSVDVTYDFELYDDPGYSNLIGAAAGVLEGVDTTSVNVDSSLLFALDELADNSTYYWRARGMTTDNATDWTIGEFFVNQANDAPNPFSVAEPLANSTVSTLSPTVVVPNPTDPDLDTLSLRIRLFQLSDLETPLIDVAGIALDPDGSTEWVIPSQLLENENYRLQVAVADEHDAVTEAPQVDFLVSTINDPPPAPGTPHPADGDEISFDSAYLTVAPVADPEGGAVSYHFELDTAATFDSAALVQSGPLSADAGEVRWPVGPLTENATYYWRARATDGQVSSGWTTSAFFVNAVEELPPAPVVANPGDDARVEVLTPLLQVFPVQEPDGDAVTYDFELYSDEALGLLVAGMTVADPQWQIDFDLDDNTSYWWRARATDEHGYAGGWSATESFFVNEDGLDDVPTLSFVAPSTATTVDTGTFLIQWTDTDPDSDARIDLLYNGVSPIVSGLAEDADGSADAYEWDMSALPPGDYLVSAIISDDSSSISVDACCYLTIPQPSSNAEILVTPPANAVVDEAGVAVAVTSVALSSAPAASVTVNVALDDPSAGRILSPATLVFGPEDWSQPQTVEVAGLDDCDVDGDQPLGLTFSPAVSDDSDYDGLLAATIGLTVQDNEVPGQELFVCDYRIAGATDLGGGLTQYALYPRLENRGPSLDGADAVAGLYPGDLAITGNDTVEFPAVASNTVVEGLQAITVAAPTGVPLDTAKLQWSITPGNAVSALTGNSSNNNLQGTEGDDIIEGLGGHDTLYGNDGDDTLIGGPGADTMYGGDGNDTVVIEGDDVHADRVSGGAGYDRVSGSTGDDAFRFAIFSGSFTVEEVDGQSGSDFVAGTSANNALDFSNTLLRNIDAIYGLGGHDTIDGSQEADVIEGGAGNDTLRGNGGDDVFRISGADAGADRVDGGDGVDRLLGSTGDDVFQLSRFSGQDTVEAVDGVSGFDLLTGTTANNVLNFSATQLLNISEIRGLEGHDTITGSGAADAIRGGPGNDTLYGGQGDDTFLVAGSAEGQDRVQGDEGTDTLLGGPLDDVFQLPVFSGARTVEVIDGNGGLNWIQGTNANNVLDFSGTSFIAIERIEGLAGHDTIRGTAGNDLILGGPGSDTLFGNAGDDTFSQLGSDGSADRFDGGDGVDTLLGVAGDETIALSTFNGNYRVEVVDGGSGVNVIAGTNANNVFDFSEASLIEIARIEGRGGHDTLRGSEEGDVIAGGAGADTVFGNGGDDTFLLDDSDGQADRFSGGEGIDVIMGTDESTNIVLSVHTGEYVVERIDGGIGENVIQGNNANNTLDFSATELLNIARIEGLGGHDTLIGSSGDDVIAGGPGNDTIQGGPGDDTFLYQSSEDGYDRFDGGDGVDTILAAEVDDAIRLTVHQGAYRVEMIDGGTGASGLQGDNANNTLDFSATQLVNVGRISGAGGHDTIFGSDANDVIVGGDGADTLHGNGGDDTFLWESTDASADRMDGGDGFDTLLGTSGDDVMRLSTHQGVYALERIDGGGGTDVIAGTNANDTLDFSLTELVGISRIEGLGGHDTITGSPDADVIVGGPGADTVAGDEGDDVFLLDGADGAADRYAGGGGFDTVLGSSADETILLSTHNGSSTVERIDGGGGFDVIAGTNANDHLNFAATELVGIARIDGLGGHDTLRGTPAADLIAGGTGNDSLFGGSGGDTYLVGVGDGQDTVTDEGNVANTDLLQYLAGVDHTQLWFYRSGSTLYVYRLGSSDHVRFPSWFVTAENRMEVIRTATHEISGSAIDALTDVMTPMGAPSGGALSLTGEQQTTVDNARSTYWQAL